MLVHHSIDQQNLATNKARFVFLYSNDDQLAIVIINLSKRTYVVRLKENNRKSDDMMELFLIVLVLLVLIGLSNIMNHFIPFIPVPLIQIGLGIVTVLSSQIHVELEPELFFLLFIAPLLFYDGKHVSRAALWELRAPILLMALGLVFMTVFAGGYVIHWLIPSIPLPAAFALAAILSPTDVVAVGSIAGRVKMPKNIMHLLEGEGLMNDASGLVAFKFAAAATVTGVFSLANATWSFFLIAVGGVLGGALLAYLIIKLKVYIRHLGMEDVTIHMLIQILTPFVIFYAMEHVHLSGILAVVAGGMVHAIERDREQSLNPELQVVSSSTWSVIVYILNGLVFVLLGLQIPSVAQSIFANPNFDNGQVLGYIVVITLFLFALRYSWIWLTWKLGTLLKKRVITKFQTKLVAIVTISGVRGTVTLAGAFSIPFVLVDGSPFPERSLLIFIAAGVILLTLVVASIFLPMIVRTKETSERSNAEEMEKFARIQTKKVAIQVVESHITDDNREVALAVISKYNAMINQILFASQTKEKEAELRQLEMDIRLKALELEDKYLDELVKEGQVERETVYVCRLYVQRMELRVTNRMKFRWLMMLTLCKRLILKVGRLCSPRRKAIRRINMRRLEKVKDLKINMSQAAIRTIKNNMTPKNKNVSMIVISDYSKLITMLTQEKLGGKSKESVNVERNLLHKAVQAERNEVQVLFEKGDISREVASKVRRQINLRESMALGEGR